MHLFNFHLNSQSRRILELDCGGSALCPGIIAGTVFGSSLCSALNLLEDGREDGCFVSDKCMGTYMHGILDNGEFIEWLLAPYADKCEKSGFDYDEFKQQQYNRLADVIREHVDMEKLYKILGRDD